MLDETEPPAAAPDDRIAWGPREIAQALGILAAGVLFVSACLAPVAVALSLSKAQLNGISTVVSLPFEFAFFGVAVVFSIAKYRLRWSALGFRPLVLDRAWVIVATVVGAFLLFIVYNLIVELIDIDALRPSSNVPDGVMNQRALVVVYGITAVLAAPIAEETLFRGFLFPGLAKRLGIFWAALASGLLFSLAHLQPTVIIPIAGIGMLFALAYVYTRSLWTSIAAHLIFNLFSFVVIVGGW